MANPLGPVIREARKARGLTQGDIASALKISRPAVGQWESGDTGPDRDRLPALARLLRVDLGALTNGELVLLDQEAAEGVSDSEALPAPTANVVEHQDQAAVDVSAFKGPRNVPVYGTGSGGDGGDFSFNGQLIDHAPRPPGIANRKDVYVVYLVGDSISPAYEDGTPIYVDPHRRPQPRDYVVVELRGERDGEPGPAFVKRLVARGAGKLRLEQHNPSGQLDPIDETEVVRVHRVIPWLELIGI
ncbi:LexA family transcriptional regulator [Methylorubrum extorquens]|uniref:Putative phage repressor n=1 Tax=Methylorubrum extorquens (strain CM4 / NCIMB 13688) TaxID=440085 RepID=B7KTG3_METC4|nr:LexA family transcriptional regulator [Methylorubrum extorquens]ACK82490.1 putative phage repressor [Methylorubrum extorquens CM4]